MIEHTVTVLHCKHAVCNRLLKTAFPKQVTDVLVHSVHTPIKHTSCIFFDSNLNSHNNTHIDKKWVHRTLVRPLCLSKLHQVSSVFYSAKCSKISFLEVFLELECYPNQKSIVILGTFSMVKIAKRHATLNSLLNQMPPIDGLLNYAWYPGTVQLR